MWILEFRRLFHGIDIILIIWLQRFYLLFCVVVNGVWDGGGMQQAISGKVLKAADPEFQRRQLASDRRRVRFSSVQGKTFEQLTPVERDMLLEHLAISAGLIEEASD